MKTVAIYLRISTEGAKGGSKGQDTGMQKLEIESYLKAKGVDKFLIYEDKGISGTRKSRPALNRMMSDCRAGKVSQVVCWKMDRLFRSLKNLLDTLSEFQALGIEFVALKDGIDLTSATGRLMMQILGAFSEFEAAVIKERVLSGLANARAKGVKLGRPMKTGHSVVRSLKEEGKTVKEIAEITELSEKTIYRAMSNWSIK